MDHLSATTLATAAGWLGAGGTVVAYALLTTDRIAARSRTFQGLNAAGAGLLALSAASHASWPSTTVNLTWMLIGLAALLGLGQAGRPERRTRRAERQSSPAATGEPATSSGASGATAGPRSGASATAVGCATLSHRTRTVATSRTRCSDTRRAVRQPR